MENLSSGNVARRVAGALRMLIGSGNAKVGVDDGLKLRSGRDSDDVDGKATEGRKSILDKFLSGEASSSSSSDR